MAYMSQEKKKSIAAKAKAVLKKHKVRGTFGVDNHSTLVLNIKGGSINFAKDFVKDFYRDPPTNLSYFSVNPYHFQTQFTGKALAFLTEIFPILNEGNHDRSDIMTDYFDVGWYVDVNVGKWNKPYEYDLGA